MQTQQMQYEVKVITYFHDYLIMLAPIHGVTNFPVYSIVHGKNFYRLIVASIELTSPHLNELTSPETANGTPLKLRDNFQETDNE